jgi:hypothetical protein
MNKTQMMNEIIRVYDENEDLKRQLQQLKDGKVPLADEGNRNPEIDDKIIAIGRERSFEEMIYSWNLPTVKIKDGDGKMNFLTFEQWLKVVDTDSLTSGYKYLLNTITFNAIKDYFVSEFKEKYEALINIAKGEVLSEAKQ